MQDSDWARCLEPALHAVIAVRCHRAYRHDLTNGLQGIYGGFDALTRLLQLPVRDLAKVVHGLAPLEQPTASIDICVMLQELVKFLINDAAAHRVTLRGPQFTGVTVRAQPHKLRLIFLSLMIDAIDAMSSGGTLQANVTTANQEMLLELSDERPGELPVDPWALDFSCTPVHRGWTLFVVRHLVAAEGGNILCEAGARGGRNIRISLPCSLE
jgi:two-component system sensor histidine kinase HydH